MSRGIAYSISVANEHMDKVFRPRAPNQAKRWIVRQRRKSMRHVLHLCHVVLCEKVVSRICNMPSKTKATGLCSGEGSMLYRRTSPLLLTVYTNSKAFARALSLRTPDPILICLLYQDSECIFSRFLALILRFVTNLRCQGAAFGVQAMRYLYMDMMLLRA